MTSLRRVLLAATVLAWVSPARADPEMMGGGSPPGPPPFMRQVFSPKLVMEHQQEIGLRPAQVEAIKRAMNEAQQQLVDLEWRLNAESEALGKLLDADRVDEAAVIAKLEQVTAIEQQVKKANFTLLVRVKNQLDPEQQRKLRAIRPGPPGHPPPPGE
jgi:Spy/CpxP family protein refolding chaperone